MKVLLRRLQRLLMLLVMLTLLATAALLATPPAGAADGSAPTSPAEWAAWGLEVDFTYSAQTQTVAGIYTVYIGSNSPVQVLDSRQTMIQCTAQDLTYAGDAAVFNGSSTYVRCELPNFGRIVREMTNELPWINEQFCTCTAGGAPLFAATDVELNTMVTGRNPIVYAQNNDISLYTPYDGVNGHTELHVQGDRYVSPNWGLNGAGNQTLMGMNGPAIVAAAHEFGWLDFLSAPHWANYFSTYVTEQYMGSWSEPPINAARQTALDYSLYTGEEIVYIGYNPANGTYLDGELDDVIVDPGCWD